MILNKKHLLGVSTTDKSKRKVVFVETALLWDTRPSFSTLDKPQSFPQSFHLTSGEILHLPCDSVPQAQNKDIFLSHWDAIMTKLSNCDTLTC